MVLQQDTELPGRKRVVIVSLGVPHERDGASVVLFYHYAEQIVKEGYAVLHVLLLEGPSWTDDSVEAYQRKLAAKGVFEVATIRAAPFVHTSPFGLWLDPAAAERAHELAGRFRPDVIVSFDIVAAWLGNAMPAARRVVWLGDLIYHAMVWHARYALREDPIRIVGLLRNIVGARLWRRAYAAVLQPADNVVVSSASSVAELARLKIVSEYVPYPWPVDPMAKICEVPALPTFMLFGTLEGLGSKSAIYLLIREIYPRLLRLWGTRGFRIVIGGRGQRADWFNRAVAGKAEFDWVGFVPDLDDVLSHCHGVLAPIDVPVGNRSRILTALAKRMLVIAHANVALGNSALVDEVTCALAANADEFVARMRRAVEDPAWARAIAERGRQCYAELFAPEKAGPLMVQRLFP